MKKGFTLSEVLTTLMIIGIIAAMTMPVVYNNVGKQRNQTMLRKIYSSYIINISQVLHLNGNACDSLSCLRNWGNNVDIEGNDISDTNKHNGTLADTTTFNVESECANCITNASAVPTTMSNHIFSTYILKNGAYVAIYDYIGEDDDDANCAESINGDFNACSILLIDVNGAKGPNSPCFDRFAFFVADSPFGNANFKPSFLVPLGYNNDPPEFTVDGGDSYNCTAKVVFNGLKLD